MLQIFLLLGIMQQPPPTYAMVGGHALWAPGDREQQMIKQSTVRLVFNDGKRIFPFCSGVVISEYEVLTAGHCELPYFEKGQVYVEFRGVLRSRLVARIQAVSIHGEESRLRDIALVRLAQPSPVKFSVPLADESCDSGSPLIAAGFGVNDRDNAASEWRTGVATSDYRPPKKTETIEEPDGFDGLQDWFAEAVSLKFNQIYLKSAKGHVCFGDSGGPVFCRAQGRLALAGISNGIYTDNHSFRVDSEINSKRAFCADQTSLTVTAIHKQAALIEKWRRAPEPVRQVLRFDSTE